MNNHLSFRGMHALLPVISNFSGHSTTVLGELGGIEWHF